MQNTDERGKFEYTYGTRRGISTRQGNRILWNLSALNKLDTNDVSTIRIEIYEIIVRV